VKFDLYNNSGEGIDSTGLYQNGQSPTTPFVDLSSTGINLHSGDIFQVHMVYDGTNLTVTITDTATNASFSHIYAVNIPQTVGGTTAFVGFTAGTGGLTATQEILNWRFVPGTGSAQQVSLPTISPPGGTISNAQAISITDATNGATIYFTTDGKAPVPGAADTTQYSVPFTLNSSATVEAIATASGLATSPVASAAFTVTGPPPSTIDFSGGFANPANLSLNNGASINGTRLRLTDGAGGETRSAFFTAPLNVQSFTSDFSFQLTNPNADGFTFTILGGNSASALGASGGGLGYAGIPSSVAVKFDLYNNSGEGIDSTGLYQNGQSPTTPFVDLSSTGINLHSGDIFQVHMVYDGTNLTVTITDTATNASFSHIYAVNIPQTVGGTTGFVGFTAGTGGLTAIQEILNWKYTSM